ncbi:hypothetical protein ONZ51_g40 [Trametes cubensis]|uniref:Uncharacterized protein n=1 Tax=Trametes cubensis TaxID=1111947 RepID=A0AAD7U468_9APHY|nr:hypothetical protein ONZ51_g40 [Trametes cubensis]
MTHRSGSLYGQNEGAYEVFIIALSRIFPLAQMNPYGQSSGSQPPFVPPSNYAPSSGPNDPRYGPSQQPGSSYPPDHSQRGMPPQSWLPPPQAMYPQQTNYIAQHPPQTHQQYAMGQAGYSHTPAPGYAQPMMHVPSQRAATNPGAFAVNVAEGGYAPNQAPTYAPPMMHPPTHGPMMMAPSGTYIAGTAQASTSPHVAPGYTQPIMRAPSGHHPSGGPGSSFTSRDAFVTSSSQAPVYAQPTMMHVPFEPPLGAFAVNTAWASHPPAQGQGRAPPMMRAPSEHPLHSTANPRFAPPESTFDLRASHGGPPGPVVRQQRDRRSDASSRRGYEESNDDGQDVTYRQDRLMDPHDASFRRTRDTHRERAEPLDTTDRWHHPDSVNASQISRQVSTESRFYDASSSEALRDHHHRGRQDPRGDARSPLNAHPETTWTQAGSAMGFEVGHSSVRGSSARTAPPSTATHSAIPAVQYAASVSGPPGAVFSHRGSTSMDMITHLSTLSLDVTLAPDETASGQQEVQTVQRLPPWIPSDPTKGLPDPDDITDPRTWAGRYPIRSVCIATVRNPRYGHVSSYSDNSGKGERKSTKPRPAFVTWHDTAEMIYVAPLTTSNFDPKKVKAWRERLAQQGSASKQTAGKAPRDPAPDFFRLSRDEREWWLPLKWVPTQDTAQKSKPKEAESKPDIPPPPTHPNAGDPRLSRRHPNIEAYCFGTHRLDSLTMCYIWAGDAGSAVRENTQILSDDNTPMGNAVRPVAQYSRLRTGGWNELRKWWYDLRKAGIAPIAEYL